MLNVVNKLKEGSIKTISSAANSILSSIQNSNSGTSDSPKKKGEDGSGETLLLARRSSNSNNNNDSDTDSDEDEQQQPFLNDILEILNVDPERRNDREEIRRKLAMGTESDDYYGGEKMTKKPSLTTRLQSGMNLQICFMNETASDQDSQGSDHDNDGSTLSKSKSVHNVGSYSFQQETSNNMKKPKSSSTRPRPSFFKESLHSVFNSSEAITKNQGNNVKKENKEDIDFVTKQARLQAEARMALAQAKEMAHMQMEIEKQRKKKSPITEMVGIAMEDCDRGISKQLLCAMNVAQLQVIVNDLHTQIETLNEELVKYLLDRDDLHMEQDSMLVDIEDLTRFLGAKDETKKRHSQRNLTKKYKKGKK
ncbi:Schwannomin-interacting protein 1 [Nymphon striatum]|nr:Schwannomin-interacting protein 1 [Nymphon striatum]